MNITADIYKNGVLAAHFTRTDTDSILFTYAPEYLHHTDSSPIAFSLPLTEAPIETYSGALPPFFTGLLPEGRRLTALRTHLKVSRDDELSLLLAVGQDTVGDVQILPHRQKLPQNPIGPVELDTSQFANLDFKELALAVSPHDHSSIPGVQEKVSGRMLILPIKNGSEFFLLKISPPEYPHLVENEHFFLSQAEKIRARTGVVKAELVYDKNQRAGLLIRRFDRGIDTKGRLVRYPSEDVCQILGKYPASKYDISSETAAQTLIDHSSSRVLAATEIFRQFVYAWLTGNGDLHAKNISVTSNKTHRWEPTPIYDVPSTAPYGDQSLALPLGGKKTGLSRKTFEDFGAHLNIPPAMVQRVLNQVLSGTEELLESSGRIPLDSHRRKTLTKILKNRRRTLEG